MSKYANKQITNWGVEHAFWDFHQKGKNAQKTKTKIKPKKKNETEVIREEPTIIGLSLLEKI